MTRRTPTVAEILAAKRADKAFMARLAASVERNKPILDGLRKSDHEEDS